MPKHEYFESRAYERLLQEIKRLFQQWERLQEARDPERDLSTFWRIGEKLGTAKLAADPAQRLRLLASLSRDLQKDRTQLFRFQQFFKQYPGGLDAIPGREALTWSHYQETLAIADPGEREFYLREALRERWPSRRIRSAVHNKLFAHYQLSRSKKHPGGLLPRVPTRFYVYHARLEEVIDPDTLRLLADQGFDGWQNLTGRLRGLNAPELHGPQRELALAGLKFVQESLGGLKRVVVQSHKGQREKYGRYLIDLFFHPLWEDMDRVYEEGFFLNQMLLDKGFARLAVY